MAYEELIPIALGGSQTGLTLRAVLREPDSGTVVNFADAATFKNTGFVERGNGEYTFHSDQFPDAFQGVVEIQLDGDSSYQASATVSPPVESVTADVAAIKAKTDNLPADPADQSLIIAATDAIIADTTAIKAKTDNLPGGVKKNTALSNFQFLMVDSADGRTPKPTLTVAAQRSIDGAAFAACANAVAELSNGIYVIDLAASDLNGDVITFRFTATGADATLLTIKTNP